MGVLAAPTPEIGVILSAVVEKESPGIYLEPDHLRRAMAEHGATETQILQVQIMTQVTGFRELLSQDVRTQQADLDRYVMNAHAETGFQRGTILELTAGIALSTGIAFDYSAPQQRCEAPPGRAFAIPYRVYQEELDWFMAVIEQGRDIPPEAMGRLEELVAAGIPTAKYYMGCCILRKLQETGGDRRKNRRGLALLEEAAADGNSAAAAALGDYYYAKKPSKAYEYYTGYGAAALTPERQNAIKSLLQRKYLNRRLLLASIVLALLLVILLFVFGGVGVLGIVCAMAMAAAVTAAILHYRVKPCDSVYWLPVVLFVLWAVYMAVRLL